MAKISIPGFKCERCGYEWVGRSKNEPKVCPKCKSPYWNTPKIKKQSEGKMVDISAQPKQDIP
jgi:predicted Zn-ribbon and HTH transcriptional regulator